MHGILPEMEFRQYLLASSVVTGDRETGWPEGSVRGRTEDEPIGFLQRAGRRTGEGALSGIRPSATFLASWRRLSQSIFALPASGLTYRIA